MAFSRPAGSYAPADPPVSNPSFPLPVRALLQPLPLLLLLLLLVLMAMVVEVAWKERCLWGLGYLPPTGAATCRGMMEVAVVAATGWLLALMQGL